MTASLSDRAPRAAAWLRRGDMALRIIAAVPLGYAVASLGAMAMARILPLVASEATIVGALLSFVFCASAAMWAFAARSGWRALWTLLLIGAVAGAVAWLSIHATGRL